MAEVSDGEFTVVVPDWSVPQHVKALTTKRSGGVSSGPYDSLNLGAHVGDSAENVQSNREFLSAACELPQPIHWLNQQHTISIQSDTHLFGNQPCDGVFTAKTNSVCAIMTADCVPVFICDRAGMQVCLVHAGWKGLADGIVERAMQLFTAPASELLIWSGPAISQQHFEIGAEVKLAIGGRDQFYLPNRKKPKHYFADLYGLIGERVKALGATYSHSDLCTYHQESEFFSYRRDGETGRMASLLWIEG